MTALAELLGSSPAIVAARATVDRLLRREAPARRLTPILIQGETGTGKGLLAQAIHRASARAAGPFVTVNCVAIPETLLESELFGFEKGAFTDARAAKPGLFQTAHHGTLVLDEVGLLPLPLQAKLLTALDERAVRRLGSTRPEPFDVQLIAATNEDLAAAMRARRFREDLYHRLSTVTITLAPLRERGADVELLAAHFLQRACAEHALPGKTLTADARAALRRHPWPGNVRELANVIERAALLTDGTEIAAAALGLSPRPLGAEGALDEMVGSVERTAIEAALGAEGGNITWAAARLGVHRNTLRYRMERLGLAPAPVRAGRPAPRPPTPSAAARWERRHVAALGVVVSAADAPPTLELGAALELLADKARAFGGTIEGLTPAGFMVAFGLEPAEDAPIRAVLAAMAVRGSVARHWRADDRARLRLAVHVGHWGVARAQGRRRLDLDATGEGWSALRGLAAVAPPDVIVASGAAVPFLRRRFHLDALPGAPPPAFRVVTDPPDTSARGRVFVGRGEELDLLRGRLHAAIAGQGAVVAFVGEPGIGKSRLLAELRRHVPEGVRLVRVRGESYATGIPFFAVAETVRRLAGLDESDAPELIAARLGGWLEDADLDVAALPLLLRLLSLPTDDPSVTALAPEAVRTRTFEAVLHLVIGAARTTPLLLECEDLHWMDGSSAAWLAALVERVAAAALLVVATYRPGYQPPWSGRSYVTQIALAPLAPGESRHVAEATLGEAPAASVVESILARAEGNPFFIEELARVVRERGAGAAVVIPETVEGTIRARIDHLTEASRRVLQSAAVLGRAFPRALLAEVCGELPEAVLAELVRVEFLAPRGHGEEPGYAFRHALLREVAYASLPEADRRERHEAAAQGLEKLSATRPDDASERLAYHYAATERHEKAIEYLTRVAERAALAYAHADAAATLEQARCHALALPETVRDRAVLTVSLKLAFSMSVLGRFQQITELLAPLRETVERLGDPALTGPYYFRVGLNSMAFGQHEPAVAAADRARNEARQCGDIATEGRAEYLFAISATFVGASAGGTAHARRAEELLAISDRHWVGLAQWVLALNAVIEGDVDTTFAASRRLRETGEAIGDARLQSFAAWTEGLAFGASGRPDDAVIACRRGLALARDPLSVTFAHSYLGHALVEAGAVDEAVAELETAAVGLRAVNIRQSLGRNLAWLAEAYRRRGDHARSEAVAREALELGEAVRFWAATGGAQRVLGLLAADRGNLALGEAMLGRALAVFETAGARLEVERTRRLLSEVTRRG